MFPLPDFFLDSSPFAIEGKFTDVYGPASKADSLQTFRSHDLFGSLDFSTSSSTIYVSDLNPSRPLSDTFTNNIITNGHHGRALTIEYLEFGERAILETRINKHVETLRSSSSHLARPVFCLWMDKDMIPLSSPVIARFNQCELGDTGTMVSVTLRTTTHAFPVRVHAVYIFTVDVDDYGPVVMMTPVFETHMLRFARYRKAYTCHLEVVDDMTRSLVLPAGMYETLHADASSALHLLAPEHITSVLRDVIDSSDLDTSEKVCAKTSVTMASIQSSRLLLQDAMVALDSGPITLRAWSRSLYTGPTSS